MTDSLILIGGPSDGLEVRAEFPTLPRTICTHGPLSPARGWRPEHANIPATTELDVLTYRLEHADDGAPSRDDQGRIRYRLEAAL